MMSNLIQDINYNPLVINLLDEHKTVRYQDKNRIVERRLNLKRNKIKI